jgi:hypothetical protein
VISIANIVVTSFYDESFIREKMMCKQHQARVEEGGWGGKEGGAGREEGKCHDALDPHRRALVTVRPSGRGRGTGNLSCAFRNKHSLY